MGARTAARVAAAAAAAAAVAVVAVAVTAAAAAAVAAVDPPPCVAGGGGEVTVPEEARQAFVVPPPGSRGAPYRPPAGAPGGGGGTPAATAPPTAAPTAAPSAAPPPPPTAAPTPDDAALARAACGRPYPGAVTPPGYCAYVGAAGLAGPRGLTVDAAGDLLLVERSPPHAGRISAVFLPDAALAAGGAAPLTVVPLVPADAGVRLNHGVAHRDGWLYASNDTGVYRWPYVAGARAPIDPSTRVTVVGGMPGRGGQPLSYRHHTRSLAFGPDGALYLSIGSRATDGVDATPARSLVKRYPPAVVAAWGADGAEPFPWQRGETWALGLRNSVGLAFDAAGTLWAVDNGQNFVVDAALGGDLTPDNPCEEINALRTGGLFCTLGARVSVSVGADGVVSCDGRGRGSVGGRPSWILTGSALSLCALPGVGPFPPGPATDGYPYCWSEYKLPPPRASVPGRQHVWPPWKDGSVSFRNATVTEAWCQTPAAVVPPAACLPAHWAPLGVAFQPRAGARAGRPRYAFPADGDGDLLVLSHGSYDRVPPVGYALARVPMGGGGPGPGRPTPLFAGEGGGGNATFASGLRLVDGRPYKDGSFVFSSDTSGELVVLRYYR